MPPKGTAGSGRKLGGLLIETVPAGSVRLAVVGVGLNILPMTFDGSQVSSGFACMNEIQPQLTAPQALARVALPLVEALQLFERQGFAAFADRFAARDVLRGCAVQAGSGWSTDTPRTASGVLGVAEGVSGTGALRVRQPDGLREVIAGEVSVRLQQSPDFPC